MLPPPHFQWPIQLQIQVLCKPTMLIICSPSPPLSGEATPCSEHSMCTSNKLEHHLAIRDTLLSLTQYMKAPSSQINHLATTPETHQPTYPYSLQYWPA